MEAEKSVLPYLELTVAEGKTDCGEARTTKHPALKKGVDEKTKLLFRKRQEMDSKGCDFKGHGRLTRSWLQQGRRLDTRLCKQTAINQTYIPKEDKRSQHLLKGEKGSYN